MLIIDSGINNADIPKEDIKLVEKGKVVSLDLEPFERSSSSVKIIINTLASFSSFNGGNFGISSLKLMTGTSSFFELPDDKKKCQMETYEHCQAQKYLKEVREQCKCLPLGMHRGFTSEVCKSDNWH